MQDTTLLGGIPPSNQSFCNRFSFRNICLRNRRYDGGGKYIFCESYLETYSKIVLVAVTVRVIKIFGSKDDHFLTLGDVTKNESNVFSHLYEWTVEI